MGLMSVVLWFSEGMGLWQTVGHDRWPGAKHYAMLSSSALKVELNLDYYSFPHPLPSHYFEYGETKAVFPSVRSSAIEDVKSPTTS